MSKDWIKGAVKHPGSFKAKATKAGVSTEAFAKSNIHASGTIGKQARLAYTLMGLHGDGKSNMKTPGDVRDKKTRVWQLG